MNAYPQFYEIVANRYSCRKYSPDAVPRDIIKAILNTAQLAPSACNRQPWEFVVIDTPQLCQEIKDCYDRDWINSVPAFIIACGNHNQAWHRPDDNKDHTDIDIAIAVEHICLAATALDLATCWICNFNVEALKKTLNTPDDIEPIVIIAIGYPDKSSIIPAKKRKSIDEITRWGKY